jgi:flagellar basal-body rod protein FlgG
MMRALSTAGTGMVAQQFNLDTIANNLANVNTTAFKAQRAEFQDLVYQTLSASGAGTGGSQKTPSATQLGLGSKLASTATNNTVGSMQSTGNPLDLSINGDGFFVLTRPDGSQVYTRDGSFKLSAEGDSGVLVSSEGYFVEPRIDIPSGVQALTVSEDGIITGILPGANEPQELGRLQIAVFANPAGLTRIGQNLYAEGGASGQARVVDPGQEGTGRIQSGFLEGSNVQIVEEMVRMIIAQRAYEINSKAVQTADDMLGILNNLKR